MPGFSIGDASAIRGLTLADPNEKYYYSYTWLIEQVFGTSDDLKINAKDATLPSINFSKEVVQGASLEYSYAKSVNWDDIRVTWYDTRGLLALIEDWRDRVWTAKQGLAPAGKYKRNTAITQYISEEGEGGPSAVTHVMHNSWPSIIRYGDITYASSDVKMVEVTITYDWSTNNSRDSE